MLNTPVEALRELLAGLPAGVEGVVAVEELGRVVDAARVRVAGSIDEGLAESLGFTSPVAAVATLARVSERTARARIRVASVTRVDRSLSGAEVPPRLPVLAEALEQVGADAAELIARELTGVEGRVPAEVLGAAETVMVNLAAGLDASGSHAVPPVSVTFLSGELRQIAATIDPDGARPREERAQRRRSFRIGVQDADGLLPVSGRLMPEVGSLLSGLMEAHRRSPRFTETPEFEHLEPADTRTPEQRRHDALTEILIAAARAKDTPTLDGMPVTVVITATATDFAYENGRAGDPIGAMTGSRFPVSRHTVDRFIDSNGLRLVRLNPDGSAAGMSTPQRCYTPSQRLQIAARDGYRCSTPGCTNPHYTLQVHHVTPWRSGAPTHVDNGILLCYWHHQKVDDGPWHYRMVEGLPEVRGPGIPEWTRLNTPLHAVA